MTKITLTPLPKEVAETEKKEKITVSEIEKLTVAELLLEQAEKDQCKLFGIVDSARNEEVFRFLITGNVPYKSLFEGTMDVQSFGVSGFLVECKKESQLFQWMTTEAWGDSCCIFFTSKADFDKLFGHFQQFNRVYLEDEKVVLFRYYDPRVLRVILPTYKQHELKFFFGEVKSFIAESEDPKIVNAYKKEMVNEKLSLKVSMHKISNETWL